MDSDKKETLKATIKGLTVGGKISIAVVFVTIAATIVMTIFNVGFTPEKFNFFDWLAKMAVNVMLTLITMFAGETAFMSFLTSKRQGLYQSCLDEYDLARKDVENETQYFGQYLELKYQRAIKTSAILYLRNNGVPLPEQVVLLDLQDVQYLDKPFEKEVDGKKLVFKSHTKRQIKAIRYVLEGNVTVTRTPKAYYLDSLSETKNVSDYEVAARLIAEKEIVKHSGRIIKIVSMLFVSMILAGLTVNEFMKGDDINAWFNLISRVTACIGGFYAGCMNSSKVNKVDCKMLKNKTTILKEFHLFMNNNPDFFKYCDEEYEAMQEFEAFTLETSKEVGGETS